MPYIADEKQRARVNSLVLEIVNGTGPLHPGDVEYALCRLLDAWVGSLGRPSFANLNAAVGLIESAKMEFYRRVVGPYENAKAVQNGEVFDVVNEG